MTEFNQPASLAVASLNAALAKAQGEFPKITKSAEVDAEKFKYHYAPLDQVLEAVTPVLAKHGLSVVQLLEAGPSLRTEIRHADGGVIGSSFPFSAPDSIKQLGSAISYIRRYMLLAMLSIAPGDDDDGAAADTATKDEPKITKEQFEKIGELLTELEERAPTMEGQQSYQQQLQKDFKFKTREQLTKKKAGAVIGRLKKWQEDLDSPI